MRDVVYAIRQFRKAPGFTFLAVLCLGLGIGVNTSIFSILNSLFLRPLPVHAPERVVVLSRAASPLLAYPDFRDFRDRNATLEGMTASNPTESSLDFDGMAHNAAAEAVSLSYPKVIGAAAYLGRWFENDDEDAIVISYRAWQRLFNGDKNVLGKRVRSEMQYYTIVGVASRDFEGIYLPMSTDLWVPIGRWIRQHPSFAARMEDRRSPSVFVFGRLKSGVAPRQASAELNAIAMQIEKPSGRSATKGNPLIIEQVRGLPNNASRKGATPVAAVLTAVAGIILLIACVNVGNLLLARGAGRSREISVKIALGARRSRLLRQLLTESILLSIGGGVAGILLGAGTNRWIEVLLRSAPLESVRLELGLDVRIMLYTATLALVTTILCGIAPAWRASQVDVLSGLKGSPPSAARMGLRRVSLVAQVSLSLILLLTAGLFLRVLGQFHEADPGFAVQNRLYVTSYISAPEFTPESGRAFYAETLDRLRALPGVGGAAITNILPLTPLAPGCASQPGGEPIPATSSVISTGWLSVMKVGMLAGRDFSTIDIPNAAPVAIVNQTMAERLWPGESAIGKRVQIGCRTYTTAEVIGVARDLKFASLGQDARPHVYRPFSQVYDGYQTIIVETPANPGALIETVRKTIAASDTSARIYAAKPLADWVDRSYWQIRWEVIILSAFAALALVLSAVGLCGMIAWHVTLRKREIGIRMAVGAEASDVVRMVLRQGLTVTLTGIAIGLAISAALTPVISKLLYGVSPTDAATYISCSLLWLLVALMACYIPARRAARFDPLEVLRNE